MAGALRCRRCRREVLTAATGRKQTLRKGEGRHCGAVNEPRTTAGGVGAKGPHGGGGKGDQERERVQDAARCEPPRLAYKHPASPDYSLSGGR